MALVSKSSCSRQTSENRLFFFRANWRSRSPVAFGETVALRVWPTRIGDSSFTLRYEMRVKEDGRLAAEGESVQVAYDYEAKRSKPIPEYFRRALDAEMAGPN